MQAYIGSSVLLPKDGVDVPAVKRKLTLKVWDHANEVMNIVKVFRDRGGYLYVPRQIGLQFVTEYGLGLKWVTSAGYVSFENTKPISLWEYQEPWVRDIVHRLCNGELDVMAMAATGKGKTIMSLEVIRRLGSTALVFVDQEFLRDQWIEAAKKFLKLEDADIGLLQGKVCDYQDKSLVIAMVQSLYDREYPKEVYEYFGTVVYDESHTLGAEQFSKVLMQFPAECRFAVSATPDRGDELQKVLEFNLGKTKVELKSKHGKSIVRYVEYNGVISWYSNVSPKTGRYINEIAADTRRNMLLVSTIKSLAETGRQVLVVSDRVGHLEHLLSMCYYSGIPEESMGLITGYTNVWKYAKDPTPPRKPRYLHKGTEYTPVKLQQVKKRTPKDTLNWVKENVPIKFATFGMFTKGVDVPALGAGVDCTPRSKAQQVHGRILRAQEGKMVPIWATIRDVMSYKAEYQFSKRLLEYSKSNAEIVQWHLTKGTKKREVIELKREVDHRIKLLKRAEIVTNVDGNYIVVTKSTGREPSREAEKPTARTTPRRRKR